MAKKQNVGSTDRRQTRKEYLLTRKQQEQYRLIRLAIFAVGSLLLAILAIGLIFEYVAKPRQAVADVNGEKITLAEWQDRVTYERHQSLATVENIYEQFGPSQVQQMPQAQGLANPQILGNQVLGQMINERLVRQEAEKRGIVVTDADIDQAIAEQFNYFDGGLPTPIPDPTQTPVPTPSITPITAADAEPTEVVEVEETAEPDPTAQPTAVSLDSYNESLAEDIAEYESYGASEADYRYFIANRLYADRLQEEFADASELTAEEENFSFYLMQFDTAEDGQAVVDSIASGEKDYLTAWNEIRSAEPTTDTQAFATDVPWTTTDPISNALGAPFIEVLQTIEIGVPSDVIESPQGFYVIEVKGREMRPVNEFNVQTQKQELLDEWLTEQVNDVITYEDRWLDNVPTRPILEPRLYTIDPAADPSVPSLPTDGG